MKSKQRKRISKKDPYRKRIILDVELGETFYLILNTVDLLTVIPNDTVIKAGLMNLLKKIWMKSFSAEVRKHILTDVTTVPVQGATIKMLENLRNLNDWKIKKVVKCANTDNTKG